MDRQLVLDGQAQVLRDDQEGTNVVATAVREADAASPGATRPISTAVAPALAARSTLRLTLQLAAIDQGDLAVWIVEIGVRSGLAVDGLPAGQPRPT